MRCTCCRVPANTYLYAVQALHFVAWRKVGMDLVYRAYMNAPTVAEGTQAAYAAWAALPHEEAGYNNTRWQDAVLQV